jgi:hypothetical protein
LWWSLLGGYDMVAMLVADRDLITRSWLKPRSRPYAPTLDTCTCVLSGCLHVLNLNSNDYESRQKPKDVATVTRPRGSFRRFVPDSICRFRTCGCVSVGRSECGQSSVCIGDVARFGGNDVPEFCLVLPFLPWSLALEFCVPGLCYLPGFLNRCVPCLSRLPRGVFEAVQVYTRGN